MSRHIVATVGELEPGGRKRVAVGGRDIALFRIGDEYHAIQDRCPHEGASLCAGRIVGLATSDRPGSYRLERQGELLRCPWHGWEFDIRTGQSWCDPDRIRVRSFATSVEPGSALAEGPYVAETFPVSVDRDYVLIETGPPGWIDAVVTERIDRPGCVVVLELSRADGAALPTYEAGAHIDLQPGPGLVRQYSLCGDPGQPGPYRIAVMLEAASRGGSASVHTSLHQGVAVRISQPRNSFRLARAGGRSVLIAGGIGITPMLSMAYALSREGGDYALHYLARTPAHAVFLGELQSGPAAAHVRASFSQGPGASRLDIAPMLGAEPDAEVYVCGPARLIEAVAAAHAALGRPPSRLHVEHFAAEVDKSGAPFLIEAARSGMTLTVPADRSIAEALIEHGVPVSVSCEQGVCGACVVAVLAGEPEHRDRVLSEDEKAANRCIALCCSRARSPLLVLDI